MIKERFSKRSESQADRCTQRQVSTVRFSVSLSLTLKSFQTVQVLKTFHNCFIMYIPTSLHSCICNHLMQNFCLLSCFGISRSAGLCDTKYHISSHLTLSSKKRPFFNLSVFNGCRSYKEPSFSDTSVRNGEYFSDLEIKSKGGERNQKLPPSFKMQNQ